MGMKETNERKELMNLEQKMNQLRPTNYIMNRAAIDTFCRWFNQMFHDDHGRGRYVSISLNSHDSLKVLGARITAMCFKIAKEYGDLRTDDTHANFRKNGLFFFIFPATSANGTLHYHGLIRIPSWMIPAIEEWVLVRIREKTKPKEIRMPPVLKDLLFPKALESGTSTLGDLHIRNDDVQVTFLGFKKSDAAKSVLAYWANQSDGEIRDFGGGGFFPQQVRMALPIREGREPMKKRGRRRSSRPRAITKPRETLNEFIARGGSVTRLPQSEFA